MTPEELTKRIIAALTVVAKENSLDLNDADLDAKVKVERPKSREHGDWATNIAMQLAKTAGVKPRDLAEMFVKAISGIEGVESAEVAGPGFINIRLEAGAAGALVADILAAGDNFGQNQSFQGQHINLEYVSANPTGPIHLGGARWAAVGDSLARLMKSSGAKVTREYYFNDHGTQIDRFAASLLAAARGLPAPEDGYGGQYIADIAAQVQTQAQQAGDPDPATLPDAAAQEYFRAHGVTLMFSEIKAALAKFRTEFDVFFHENSLYETGKVEAAIEFLDGLGEIAHKDGATWLLTTKHGDDKDRVLIKSDGNAAYFAADIAYYRDKRERGADCAIYLLGADHHGYIGRMMAMCAAFGDTPGVNLQILIGQLVNLYRSGQLVKMSKRAGNIVTLDDFVEAVGVDAARYSLVRSSMDTQLDIDLDVLASHTNENPVYYVQYAHARTCNVAKNAASHGVSRGAGFDPGQLRAAADGELIGVLAQFPTTVAQAATERAPHLVARYLENLAGAYHAWYGKRRVTPAGDDPVTAEHAALLALNDAVTVVLRNGLNLLGVSAPERM
ncbi:arginine--tRNA ligase [Mobiluncus mulieris]|uniref:Arginine--tRNA ligase n=1 Tax=Mobiluncus mulieris TaxID=2052 RepID=A0A848RFF3_9ACTO|nr:arginine--tRNA ligase [Mobiluncus mulieris]NMW62635.1 arginine--tRNA ligase [Mobiluncus mulieris]NMW92600.1 arginine--tRNA ligase [Mobiluncus mulieris]PNL43041.1 arginine--tRNA ligase [Mobiluncus mulieris]